MQEYYGLNLDDMGEAYTPWHAGSLLMQLPVGARLRGTGPARPEWSLSERMLSLIEYDLRAIAWSLGGGKGAKPQPIRPETGGKGPCRQPGVTAMAAEDLEAALKPRKED